MGELKHLIVQVLDEKEKALAESVLNKHHDVSLGEYYVRGYGDEKDIKTLRAKGLIVEHFGKEELGLNWLEPEPEEEGAEALSDEADMSEPSLIEQTAHDSPDVVILQLKGPLRAAWKEQLDKLGVNLIEYKPEFAFKVMLQKDSRSTLENLGFVERVVDYQPSKRLRTLEEEVKRAKIINALQEQRGKAEKLGEDLFRVMKRAGKKIKEEVVEHLKPQASTPEALSEGSATAETGTAAKDFGDKVGDLLSSVRDRISDQISDFFEPEETSVEHAGEATSASEGMPAAAEAESAAEASVEAAEPAIIEAETASDEPPAETGETPDVELMSAGAPGVLRYELKCHLADQIPVLGEVLKKDARIQDIEVGRLRIRFACREDSPVLKELSEMTQMVSRVDPYIEPEIADEWVRVGIGLEREDMTPILPWKGSDIIVGVADTGVDKEHPDLKTKVMEIIPRAGHTASTDENGHGTHVCGIIAGDGTASKGNIRGIASGAKIVVQGIVDNSQKFTGLPIDLGDLFKEAYDKDARIHNNSWGIAVKGLYSIDSYEVDEFVYNHPDFLVIFSAGNDGRQVDEEHPDPDPPDVGRILPMSLRSPATSKNALTVGACCSMRKDGPYEKMPWSKYRGRNPAPRFPVVANEPICGDLNYLAAFSSRGPSDDERIKPDLVAPGTVIVSARSSNAEARDPYEKFDGQYMYLSGTSQAAPIVAGAAAIIREYYIKEHERLNPSAALLKATLINGTQWISTQGALWDEIGQPNFHQGFGRLDLKRTLPVPGNAEGFRLLCEDIDRKDAKALNKGVSGKGRWARRVGVEKGMPLRVTLAWTDKPGKGLQQDLDLIITLPGGKKMVGNHFLKRISAFPTDHRNNVEQVFIDAPEPGDYTINVLAYNTPFEDQGFGLVVTGKLTTDFLP